MTDLLNNWNWMRFIRLALGSYMLYGGFTKSDNLMLFFGSILAIQAVFNLGCSSCSSGNCEIPFTKSNENEKLDIK